jgi:hypothetical protein
MSRSRIIPGIEIAERMTCRILNAITPRNVHDRPGAGKMASVHRLFLRISRLPKQALLPGLGSIGSSIRTNAFSKDGTGRRCQIEVIWVMISDGGRRALAGT